MRRLSIRDRISGLFEPRGDITLISRPEVDPRTRITMYNAINGKVIEVATYDPKPHSNDPDWEHEFYVVPEGESLSAAVSTVMTMKGLTK
jgi:hypothetical protein